MYRVRLLLLCSLFFVYPLALLPQSTVYLRDASLPSPKQITNAADNGNYIRLSIAGHGFQVGNKIAVQGVRGCWRANGTRTVAGVPDANTVDLLARDGATQLDCGGTWVAPRGASDGAGMPQAWAAKLTAYTLKAPPNIEGFDGPSGSFTTGLAGRVNLANPAWAAIKAEADARLSNYTTVSAVSATWAGAVASLATVWHATGRAPGSPYLTAAKYLLNNAHRIGGAAGCEERYENCARSGYLNTIDQIEYHLHGAVLAFSILHNELSEAERTAFAEKMLNDLGRNNASEASCANPFTAGQGTATTGSKGQNFITITPATAIANVQVGDFIAWHIPPRFMEDNEYYVQSKNDATGVITLNKALGDLTATGTTWYYVRDPVNWNSSRCGHVWFQKHFGYQPGFVPVTANDMVGAPYPPSGGYTANEESNLSLWRLRFYADTGAATCPVDQRGCELYEESQAYYFDRVVPWHRNLTTGMTQAGSAWYKIRVDAPLAQIAVGLKSQLTTPIDVSGGNWLKQLLMFSVYQLLPGSSSLLHSFGERSDLILGGYSRQGDLALAGLFSSTPEAGYWRYWLKNSWGGYSAGGLSPLGRIGAVTGFLGVDWDATATDYSSLPTQRVFGHPTDLDASWMGTALPATGLLGLISKSSWAPTATSIHAAPLGFYADHSYFRHLGHYQIYKGNWLYGDTRGTSSVGDCNANGSSCFTDHENHSGVEVGRASSATDVIYDYVEYRTPDLFNWNSPANNGHVSVKRWAGDPFAGRSDSAYSYLAFDGSTALRTNLTGPINYQHYHYLHVKGGGRDYLLRYVDTSLGSSKRMRTYLHFPNNGQNGEGRTSSDSSGVIRTTTNAGTSMDTRVLLPSAPAQTDVHVTRTSNSALNVNGNASSTHPVRHRTGGASCSYTEPGNITITPGSTTGMIFVWIDTSDCAIVAGHSSTGVSGVGVRVQAGTSAFPGTGIYPVAVYGTTSGGLEWTAYVQSALPHGAAVAARRYVVDLGTGTGSEYLVLHEPHGNTSESVSPASVTTASSWQTVEIAHSSLPAVAAFARGGQCHTSWTHRTGHNGTAQYIIAGLCSGRYNIIHEGASIGSLTVASGDESATWNGPPGSYTVSQSGSALRIVTTGLPPGTQGVEYAASLAAVDGAEPYSWELIGGTLPEGLFLAASGQITGAAAQPAEASITVRVTDSGNPASTAEASFVVTIHPAPVESLRIRTSAIGSNAVILAYGRTGLPAETRCMVQLSDREQFEAILAEHEDTGGAAIREVVFGETTPLTPEATYYVRASCGEESATLSFTTLSRPLLDQAEFFVRISGASAAGLNAARMRVDYGLTEELGSSMEVPCLPSGCSAVIVSNAPGIAYSRRLYLNSQGLPVARSLIRPLLFR